MCYRCTNPRYPSSAHHNRTSTEALLPTPGWFVLALQLEGSAAPARETTGNLVDLLKDASPVSMTVLGILLVFSVISWAIVLYKAWAFRPIEKQTATFLDVFRRSTKFSEVQAVCKSLEGSPLVGMFQAGYAELNLQLRHAGRPEQSQRRRRSSYLEESWPRWIAPCCAHRRPRSTSWRNACPFWRRRRASRRSSGCSGRSGAS